jgi:ABC-type branched-subunit amino acid transport system ATPase component
LQVADRIFVLRSGQVALSGPPEEMADRLRVETAYFGVA